MSIEHLASLAAAKMTALLTAKKRGAAEFIHLDETSAVDMDTM